MEFTTLVHAPVIVIGMHRSGTSLFANILLELGIHIGDDLSNHHESIAFKRLNDVLLRDQGAHWANPQPYLRKLSDPSFITSEADKARRLLEAMADYGEVAHGQPWGWKDPRTTITLPVWLKIFPEARVIHMIRNGIDVGMSLQRREPRRLFSRRDAEPMIPPLFTRGYRLWAEYLQTGLDTESLCRHYLLMRYEDLIDKPTVQLNTLCTFLNINAPADVRARITHKLVGRPTKRAAWETRYLQLLFKLGAVDPAPLARMGYEPGV